MRVAAELLVRARSHVGRSVGSEVYVRILEEADDAADGLEEAAFLMTLLATGRRAAEDDQLQEIARLLVEASREFVKCVEAASHVHRGSAREDVQDFLEAVDHIVTVEHQVDEAERRVIAALFAPGTVDLREAHVVSQIVHSLEADVPAVQELDTESLKSLARENLDLVLELTGEGFPQDPMEQLTGAVEAVFRSWESPRAAEYRRLTGLDGRLGTAVLIQPMVFGNAGGASGSGVGFTRNPATGANELYVDFLFNSQGDVVVLGRLPITDTLRLRTVLPAVDAEIQRIKVVLEGEFRDLQDFEFTVEEGRLYMLQTRAGKRTPWAALRIAVEMVREGLIDPRTALERLRPYDLDRLERVYFVEGVNREPLATAVPAGSGVAVGTIALDTERAQEQVQGGGPVILVREEISPDDIGGISVADGVLTAAGGWTSHAAVVARHLGKACLVGCTALRVDLKGRRGRLGDHDFVEGDWLSLDSETGRVYAGKLSVARERPEEACAEIERWREALRSEGTSQAELLPEPD